MRTWKASLFPASGKESHQFLNQLLTHKGYLRNLNLHMIGRRSRFPDGRSSTADRYLPV